MLSFKSKLDNKGFLILEVLISGLIVAASIAASMYLFRVGLNSLHKARTSNIVASKVPVAVSVLKNSDLMQGRKTHNLGDGVKLKWRSRFYRSGAPKMASNGMPSETFEVSLYKITFTISLDDISEDFEMNAFRFKRK